MSVSKIATSAILALSLVAVPTIAAAAPAANRLSVTAPTTVRIGAPVARTNKGGGSSIIIAVLAAAAVIAGIVIAADGNKKATSA